MYAGIYLHVHDILNEIAYWRTFGQHMDITRRNETCNYVVDLHSTTSYLELAFNTGNMVAECSCKEKIFNILQRIFLFQTRG